MATVATTTSGISSQFQRYFSKELLDYITQQLQLVQLAQKAPLPEKSGSKTIRWHRFDEPSTSSIQTLTEGTAISSSDYRTMSLESVDADLVQYGQVISITDVLRATELFNHLEQAVKVTGQDAALHADSIVRNELGGSVSGKQERYAGTASSYSGVGSASAGDADVGSTDVLDCATNLRQNNAPTIGGSFVGVAGPEVLRDLMTNNAWLNAAQYSSVEKLYRGEVGSLYGVKFLQTTVPFRSDGSTQNTYDSSGSVYSTFVFGADAFGTPELSSQSAYSPSVYVTEGASKDDPLNQQTKCGYKSYFCGKVLQPKYYVEMYSQTSFS
tara:strand:+ start:5159 stop:6139 length:981 start_codon:yes stop_codon:yes gene_type:complete